VGTTDGWYVGQYANRIFGVKDGIFKWLTPPNADVQVIDITPDGSYIAYTDYTDNIVQLYRMNPDGTDAIGITPTTERFQFAAWAEDGLYTYATSGAGRRLYHVNLDGSEPELLLDVGVWDRWFGVRDGWTYFVKENHLRRQNIESGEDQTIATVEEGELYTITATRDWLYFATFNQTLHETSLFRVRPDGSELSEVLHTQSGIDNLLTSPDREYAIFLGSTESYAFRGNDRWKLAVDSSYNFAGWTPDGTEMIFNPTQVACPCNVMTMKPDGSDKRFITDVGTQAYYITKAPVEDQSWTPLIHTLLGAVILVGGVIWWWLALKRG
jgi:Tol biopolymer transport system component